MESFLNEVLENISSILTDNVVFAPLLALLAGVLTSFTPCSISSIPLIVGYVGGTGQKDTKRSFKISLVFALGSAVTFTVLGIVASMAGNLIGNSTSWWYMILAILMVLMALQTWGLFEIIPSSYLVSKNKKRGYLGAFITGVLAGVFSSPCSTPVLIVLLAVVANEGSVIYGIVLLLLYSIGHGVLSIVAGTSMGFVQKLSGSEKYGKVSKVLNIIMGSVILLVGFYLFYLAF